MHPVFINIFTSRFFVVLSDNFLAVISAVGAQGR